MIRIEVICAHASKDRAHDAKFPCDSTRNRSLAVDVEDSWAIAKAKMDALAKRKQWIYWKIIPGLYKALICENCGKRARGEI